MKPILILLVVVFYIEAVCGKNLHLKPEVDEESNIKETLLDSPKSQGRHRRRTRQSFNGYDYNDDIYGRRRDDLRRDYFNPRQEVYLSQILDKLNEISFYLKQSQSNPPPPPPPPQIIYIPYPVLQWNPNNSTGFIPNLPPRTTFADKNQNWGLVPGNLGLDIQGDGSRPIDLKPKESNEPTVKPPPVDHGTTQAGCIQDITKSNGNNQKIHLRRKQRKAIRNNIKYFSYK
ncbi:uncharacterized protein LOC112042847 isoform X2 [Bicyclus anynana]|uniref:Uncharacterized protein LOC112042847 isoform X2 n=1 Tax=Bicyclus anynana TaxID=110368 RepID=A0A6J1MHH8_BICAN|nr:uncharacterized protein LOC112042847 isoform X2 [Bicyclus anynana]